MAGWFEHMPIGMFLKSTARDSSIGSPHQKTGIGNWCEAASVEPFDKGGAEIPIPVNDFIEYGRWFQGREVPELEQAKVTRIARSTTGFEVELASGERVKSATVIVAVGTAPFAYMPDEFRTACCGTEWARGSVSHPSDHHDLSGFSGKMVAVIGRGQSALETAALLHEAGATVHVLVRSPAVVWGGPPPPPNSSFRHKLRTPPSQLGDGWTQLFITAACGRIATSPIAIAWRGYRRSSAHSEHGGSRAESKASTFASRQRWRAQVRTPTGYDSTSSRQVAHTHSSTWTTSYPQPATASTCNPWTSSPTRSGPRSKRSKDPPD